MLPRYFNAMVKLIRVYIRDHEKAEKPGVREELQKHLYANGFNKSDIEEAFPDAKARAIEQLERAKANGGKLPVRVRIFDTTTDEEESSFLVDNILRKSPDWLMSKILYAVNNRKAVEISSIDD